jgi:hypothetical protein
MLLDPRGPPLRIASATSAMDGPGPRFRTVRSSRPGGREFFYRGALWLSVLLRMARSFTPAPACRRLIRGRKKNWRPGRLCAATSSDSEAKASKRKTPAPPSLCAGAGFVSLGPSEGVLFTPTPIAPQTPRRHNAVHVLVLIRA